MSDADLAIAAAEAGAAVVRARFGQPLDRYAKSGRDFATAADIESEKAILDVLRAARPGDAVLAEESGADGDPGADRVWLVDPLCGTHNFAARTPLVAVNVALRTGGEVTAAASADPFGGEVFWTDGAVARVRVDGADRPLTPDAAVPLVDVNLEPPFANGPGFRAVRLLGDVAFTQRFGPRVSSSTLALLWVAAGRRAGFVSDSDLRDNVHFAAPVAVCRAAGCVVTGLRGQPVYEGAGGLVAAADRETHDALLAMVGKQFRGS
ncbi:inositol monophosphatase family protein [Phytohabitans sp. ZYX-F-186]|uniref:Inositol monophosphatase family protein n=1 Tax=Phytohabitans maris TaxID=3071409 RepID=A0ABU0ZCZ2_9ACTN|nr:inositol monophosphatase family protein [Phytohabitans sp. ZYX-F-186]MDQ7904935.1 inositol monophosphatase family protein [Phytohabitans sp. ZYX-F-186]